MAAPHTPSLIDVDGLGELVSTHGGSAIIDVRWSLGGPPGASEYRKGHIPGAAYVDLDDELAAPPSRAGRHPLPLVPTFAQAMRRSGVRADRPVVVYDAGTSMAAARAWWLLRHHGHPDVRVLDGGLAAWLATGHPVETVDPNLAVGDFDSSGGASPVVDADGAATLARTGVLLDARAPERYRGEVEPVDPVAGHIPGAVSAPTTANLGTDGRFLSPQALRARFEEIGVRPGVSVGTYCGSGVTAAHELFALEVAGFSGAALYPGSWSEWAADSHRPVATGPDRG